MEYGNLPQFILILLLIGMIIGVGVLTFDKFGNAVLNNAVGTQKNLKLWTNNFTSTSDSTITASSITAVNSSGAGSVTVLCNHATKWECSSLKLVSPVSANGTNINISYTYGTDSKATDAMQASRDEVSNVSTVWLGLIVTIAVLSIILGLVISSFARSFGRQ